MAGMKHIVFPTVADADAFISDLQSQGVVRPEVGTTNVSRRTTTTTDTYGSDTYTGDAGAGAEDAGAGAVKGTGVGALVGAAAGILGAGAVVASGGLALPVILGMTALGSGVGAAVGATGGAMGIDENADGRTAADGYVVDDADYDHMHTSVSGGGRAVAVDEHVPADVLDAAVRRHNGSYVSGTGVAGAGAAMAGGAARVGSAAGDVAGAAGNKLEEGADRLRAVGHEVAGAVTGNPKHDALAAEDRTKANMNNDQADRDMMDADRKV